jgi:hypothetical protein
MSKFETPVTMDLGSLDPNGGAVAYTTYWRPRAGDADPEMPGEKLAMLSYLPTKSGDLCPCGSGKRFGICCQLLPYWELVCRDPDVQGYSLMRPQEVRFANVPTDAVYTFLQNDERLSCVEDALPRAFWNYWGDPAFETPYGMLCFGDLELQEDRTLLVTAISDKRMQVLLDLLQPLNLGNPPIQHDPSPRIEKPVRKVSGRKRRRRSSTGWGTPSLY